MISLYAPRQSALHRLNPVTKLVISLGFITFALGVAIDWVPLAVFVFVLVPLSLVARVGREFVSTSLRLLLPFAISLFLIQSLFFPEGDTVLAQIGPLSIKAEGVRFAFASSARILLIAGAMLVTLITTHPGALMTSLVQKGFPSALAYVVVTTLQIVPVMRERARTIVDAQRSRGLETEGSFLTRVRALVPLIGPLVLGSLLDVEERSLALEARGFSATTPKTSLFDVPDRPAERLLRWAIVLLIVGTLVFRLVQTFR